MSDEVPAYRFCLNCGRPIPLQANSKQVYCSPECSRENLRCPVCGRYFETGTGTDGPDGTVVCSPECAQSGSQFDVLFKELS